MILPQLTMVLNQTKMLLLQPTKLWRQLTMILRQNTVILLQLTMLLLQLTIVLSRNEVFPAKHCCSVATQDGFGTTQGDSVTTQCCFVTEQSDSAAFYSQEVSRCLEMRRDCPDFKQKGYRNGLELVTPQPFDGSFLQT